MNRRSLMTLMAAASFAGTGIAQASTAQTTTSGRIVQHAPLATTLVKPRNVTVWLPPGYDASDARYPVLYMHDGQNLFDASTANYGEWGVDEHLERLIATGQVRAPIVVGVWNTDLRLRDYVPADLVNALPADMKAEVVALYGGEPLSDGYIRFLADELKPFIDSTYRTLTGPQDTSISGSSMGGLISMYAVMKRPDVFSAAACLSTHWPLKILGDAQAPLSDQWQERLLQAWTALVEAQVPAPGTHRFYFDRGDATIDKFYADYQDHMDGVFQRKGYRPGDYQSLLFPGALHNEASWNQRLDVPLTFLLSPAPTRNP